MVSFTLWSPRGPTQAAGGQSWKTGEGQGRNCHVTGMNAVTREAVETEMRRGGADGGGR